MYTRHIPDMYLYLYLYCICCCCIWYFHFELCVSVVVFKNVNMFQTMSCDLYPTLPQPEKRQECSTGPSTNVYHSDVCDATKIKQSSNVLPLSTWNKNSQEVQHSRIWLSAILLSTPALQLKFWPQQLLESDLLYTYFLKIATTLGKYFEKQFRLGSYEQREKTLNQQWPKK